MLRVACRFRAGPSPFRARGLVLDGKKVTVLAYIPSRRLLSTEPGNSILKPLHAYREEVKDAEGNRVLYHMSQELTCRVMLSASFFNLFYWSYYLATCAYYKDVVVNGIDLGGDPRWGFVGAFGTGLMFYVSQQYSHHTVSSCYETTDGERLGFQMHNVFGQPGRRIECRIGNASMLDPTNSKKTTLGSSYVPLRIKGVDRNVLVDETGNYFVEAEGSVPRLITLINSTGIVAREGAAGAGLGVSPTTSDKAKRIEFYKQKKRSSK